jgi:hypothetical protein
MMHKKHLLLRDFLTMKALDIKGDDKKKRELRSLDKASYTSFFKNAKLTKLCLYHSNIKNSCICFLVFNSIMDYMNDWHDRKHIRYRPIDIRKKFNIHRSSWDKARKLLLKNNMIEFYETDEGTCIKIPLPSEWSNLNEKQIKLIRKEIASTNEEDSVLEKSDAVVLNLEPSSDSQSDKKKKIVNIKSKKQPPIIYESGRRLDIDADLDRQLIKELEELDNADYQLTPKQKVLRKMGLK